MKRKFLLLLMLIMTSVASWAADPYYEIVSGSFASGNVTVKVTFPDAGSVTGAYGAWVYLDYDGNGKDLGHASGSSLTFPGDNTFIATFSFTCPENAQDELFTVSPYNNDVIVDGVSQPRTLVIRLNNCKHTALTLHAATNSTESTHGNEAHNECTQCGRLFRLTDAEHTTPLTLEDLQLPLVCAAPHYEIISGSFATGDAKVRVTFPKATEVATSGLFYIYYGRTEQTWTDKEVAYASSYYATVKGNTVTVDFSHSTFDNPADAEESLYYIYLYDNSITIDGVANTDMVIRRPVDTPKAEVLSGSLTEGSLQVKFTIPLATSISDVNLYSYSFGTKGITLKNGDDVLQYKTDDNNTTVEGNTLTTTFEFTPQVSDDLSNCSANFDYGCVKIDDSYIEAITINFYVAPAVACAHENLTRREEVESTDQVHGHSAYDQCDACGACFATDDTEHENALTPSDFILPLDEEPIDYFYVHNLDPIRTMIGVPQANLEYRLEGGDGVWRTVTTEDESTLNNPAYKVEVPAYGKVYLRATTAGNTSLPGSFFGGSKNDFPVFEWEGEPYHSAITDIHYTDARVHYAIGGDITTLLRSNGKVKTLPEPIVEDVIDGEEIRRGIFESKFTNSGNYLNGYLVDASNLKLPSTTLSERCYYEMFERCDMMTAGPQEISAITMAPYSCYHMFNWCHQLPAAPAIKAKSMAEHSCDGMFYMGYGNISQLASVPDLEVETAGEYSCYNMFANCGYITKAPEIPATTVAPHCFEYMFNECISLATAPTILPATTLAEDCYRMMFYNCKELQRAPELPAPSLVEGCYVEMFYNCYNLNYIKVGLMTDWPVRITYNEEYHRNDYDYYCTRNWVSGVNGNGTFCGPTCLFKEIYVGATQYDAVPYYYNGSSYIRWNSETALTVPVTISSVGYATFCYDYNWIIPEGTEGYIAYVDEAGVFHFEKGFEPGDIVQSYRSAYDTYEEGNLITQWVCRAVVLKGAPGTYDVTLTDIDAPLHNLDEDPNQLNALYGSMHDFDISLFRTLRDETEGIWNSDYYYYTLSLDEDGENVGFYWMKEDGAPFVTKPYKAFLRAKKVFVDGSSAKKSAFVFDENDNTITAISDAIAPVEQQTPVYDLCGRRVNATGKSGLYIINGKKVMK